MIIVGILGIIIIGAVLVGPVMSNVENPSYEVIQSDKKIEIRKYQPMIVAQVELEGNRKEAIQLGFRILADYIFGSNTTEKDIAMTAPVEQESSQKIPMTAPVEQELSGNSWKIRFVMPKKYTLETLPKPKNPQIRILEIPEQTYVVIRFSGTASDRNIKVHETELMDYVKRENIPTVGSTKYAFYNPPWTLPFLKRNEVMIQEKP